jgi:branched-chain amino acid transport system substrate-binding protein
MKRALLVLVLIGVGLHFALVRNNYMRNPASERSDAGTTPWIQRGFSVAIVWPYHPDVSLVEGVTLAYEEINAGGGPLAGKIKLKFLTESGDGGQTAREVVKQKDVVAVIGHELMNTSIPASVVYEKHGVLFISPKSTDVRLTDHGFQFVFRLTPDDTEMMHALADFAQSRDWKRIAVMHDRTDAGDLATAEFLSWANRLGLSVPVQRSFFNNREWYIQDFRPQIADVRTQNIDAVAVAHQLPWAAKLLYDMAVMGVSQPIIATDKLDSVSVYQLARTAANNLYVVSAVDPESTEPEFAAFRERFKKRFNAAPGYGASQGYEALMLFANACIKSNDADPLVLATTLRTNTWKGLFGEFTFAQNGDVEGRSLSIKRMQDGVFHTVLTLKEKK